MSHRATRGVCIGVDRHLKAGGLVPADVDAATLQFLRSIGAVEFVTDAPVVEPVVLGEPTEIKAGAEEPKPEAEEPKPEAAKKKK